MCEPEPDQEHREGPAEVNNSFCIIIPQTAIIIYFLTYAQVRSAN